MKKIEDFREGLDNVKEVDFTKVATIPEDEKDAVLEQFKKSMGMTDEQAQELIAQQVAKEAELNKAKEAAEPTDEDKRQWMSLIIGLRGDAIYECKTNVKDTMLTDYIEAAAGIEMNMIVTILKTNNIKSVKTFMKMKELLMLNSVRMIGENFEAAGLTAEQYAELRQHFNVDSVEAMLEQRKEEIEKVTPEGESEKEEPFKIEV